MPDFDCVVIGGGLLGVACANLIAQKRKRVVVIESQAQAGTETSSRNSGVIHAGLYYPPGSLKAIACTEGRRLLYKRCEVHRVAHERLGKIVVACDRQEVTQLETIFARAQENGAGAVRLLTQKEAKKLEPHVRTEAALFSPQTGIVDVHELLYSHKKQALDGGADFSFNTTVEGLELLGSSWKVSCRTKDEQRFTVSASVALNAAGLHAAQISGMAGVDLKAADLVYHWCKGDYFSLAARHRGRVKTLVYPVPTHAGLGVHLTKDLAGQVSAGPDTEYVDEIRYDIDESKRAAFGAALRRYYPDVTDEDLSPAYAGVRPKLQGPDDEFRDFVVRDLADLGAPRMIALLGIESPGLTASEYLAERATELVCGYL